jgi:hypothetical protein
MATAGQKQVIMKLASMKGLYDYSNSKDISKLQEFCNSNGYCLKELKFDEVEPLLELLEKYEIKEEFEVFDADFKHIEEDDPQLGFEVN